MFESCKDRKERVGGSIWRENGWGFFGIDGRYQSTDPKV